MHHDFDVFVKEHLQAVLCTAEKEQALASIRKNHVDVHKPAHEKSSHQVVIAEVQLQDCAVSPTFSHSQL